MYNFIIPFSITSPVASLNKVYFHYASLKLYSSELLVIFNLLDIVFYGFPLSFRTSYSERLVPPILQAETCKKINVKKVQIILTIQSVVVSQ